MKPVTCASAIVMILTAAHLIGSENTVYGHSSKIKILETLITSKLEPILEILSKAEDFALKRLTEGVSDNCAGHTQEWMLQLMRLYYNGTSPDLWALQMVDAFAKLPEGILSGHINSFGDFDECVGVNAHDVNFSRPIQNAFPELPNKFSGQYCTTYLIPEVGNDEAKIHKRSEEEMVGNSDLSRDAGSPQELLEQMAILEGLILLIPSAGVCLPSTCSSSDAANLTRNLLTLLGFENIAPSPTYCTTETKPDLDVADYSVITLLGVLFGLCFVAAVLDMKLQRKEIVSSKPRGLATQYFLAFSFYTNIRKWLNTKSSGDDFGCIHGIRFLSTSWVVLGHTWYLLLYIPQWNMLDVKTAPNEDWTILAIINSTVSVDTFFVMGGMLVCYNLLKLLEKTNGKLNLPLFYIHRYLRVTPTYAILVGIMATIIPYAGSGPFWFWMDRWAVSCEVNWWTNLLYVNNFVNTNRMCQGEAWYLACDMQFYILSPLFIYPLWRWKKLGLSFLGVSTILSILCPALIIYFQEPVAPTMIVFRSQGDHFMDVYIKPYTRIQAYLVGIALGYILYQKRGKTVRMSTVVQVLAWVLSAFLALGTLYGIFPWYNPAVEIPRVTGALYGGFQRFAWSAAISWVIFACIKGYGGIVNDFLSWKAFVPLGRLCFCVYLTSLHLQMALHLRFRQPITYEPYTMTNFFFSHLMMSFLVGFICTLTFESPFIIIEKLIFEGSAKAPVKHNAELKRPADRNGIFYEKHHTSINTDEIQSKEV